MGVEDQLVHTGSRVFVEDTVEIQFEAKSGFVATTVLVDRATAARLINQLRRALDDSYNQAINDRPGGSDDYA